MLPKKSKFLHSEDNHPDKIGSSFFSKRLDMTSTKNSIGTGASAFTKLQIPWRPTTRYFSKEVQEEISVRINGWIIEHDKIESNIPQPTIEKDVTDSEVEDTPPELIPISLDLNKTSKELQDQSNQDVPSIQQNLSWNQNLDLSEENEYKEEEKYLQEDSNSSYTKKDFKLREDVLNKNIIRAVRREWKLIYDNFCLENNFIAVMKPKFFKPNLKKLSKSILSETSINWRRLK